MYIVMVAPECAPAAKVGGLANVVFGLSRELEQGGQLIAIPTEYGATSEWQVTELAVRSGLSAALVNRRCSFILSHRKISVDA